MFHHVRRCTFIKNVYQLVLAGARLTAETAEEYGFVDKVVDDVKDLEAGGKVERNTYVFL